jgi:hypothetical protein
MRKLIPTLDNSCDAIIKEAYASHVPCYNEAKFCQRNKTNAIAG